MILPRRFAGGKHFEIIRLDPVVDRSPLNGTDLVISKLCWQITVDSVKPVAASEYAQFSNDVVVSAVTRQWIVVDQHSEFVS